MTDELSAERTRNGFRHRRRDKLKTDISNSQSSTTASPPFRQKSDHFPVGQIKLSGAYYAQRYRLTCDDQYDMQQDLCLWVLTSNLEDLNAWGRDSPDVRASPNLSAEEIDAAAGRLARNYALRLRRKSRRQVEGHVGADCTEDSLLQLPTEEPSPVEAALYGAKQAALKKALATLSELDRALVIDHHAMGVSVCDLAHQHGLSVSAVKTHLSRARRKLRTFLIANGDDIICRT